MLPKHVIVGVTRGLGSFSALSDESPPGPGGECERRRRRAGGGSAVPGPPSREVPADSAAAASPPAPPCPDPPQHMALPKPQAQPQAQSKNKVGFVFQISSNYLLVISLRYHNYALAMITFNEEDMTIE